MTSNAITVVYKWIAKPEKLGELTEIYKNVTKAMEENEPGATAVHVYVSQAESALYVRDELADANALGFHLSQTVAAHFPGLLEVANPGPFYLFGDVPNEMQQAARQ
jgi:quinol monooxygenase YgiN